MSERAKPKQLLRERLSPAGERQARERQARERQAQLIDQAQRIRRERQGQPIVRCQHNIDWRDCRICSKAKN